MKSSNPTERAMVLCQRPGINWERAWWALYSMFWIRQLRPETRKACEIAEELVEQGRATWKAVHQAEAELSLAWARMYAGDFELADQSFDRGWALLESIEQAPDRTPPRSSKCASSIHSGNSGPRRTIGWSRVGICGSSVTRSARWSG